MPGTSQQHSREQQTPFVTFKDDAKEAWQKTAELLNQEAASDPEEMPDVDHDRADHILTKFDARRIL